MSAAQADDRYGTADMRAVFAQRGELQRMLHVEAALARAQARLGIVPAAAADAIAAAAQVERLEPRALAAATRLTGYPVVGLVAQLARAAGDDAGRYVHWGATTQDVLDTVLVLQMRDALDLCEHELRAVAAGLVARADAHRGAVMAGRTHLQHALPITFGYKCAIWLAPLLAHLDAFASLRDRVLVVEFGGAVGTLAALGGDGRAVCVELARELGLGVPEAPWHVRREGPAEVVCRLGLLCGSLAKFATDVVLLMQTEVAEASEAHEHGRGGSSTMPQKRNPIASEYLLASARAVQAQVPLMLGAMAGDHERSTGPWQTEALALPNAFVWTSGALARAREIAEGLRIDAARMRSNVDITRGAILAEAVMMKLAPALGRGAAHDAVERATSLAAADGLSLADALQRDATVSALLDPAALRSVLDPARYVGEASAVVDRVLAHAARVLAR